MYVRAAPSGAEGVFVSAKLERRTVAITFLVDALVLASLPFSALALVAVMSGALFPTASSIEVIFAAALVSGLGSTLSSLFRRSFGGRLRYELLFTGLAIAATAGLLQWFLLTRAGVSAASAVAVVTSAGLLAALLAAGWRWLAIRWRIRGFVPERVAVLGTGPQARRTVQSLQSMSPAHCRLVAVISSEDGTPPEWLPAQSRFLPGLNSLQTLPGLAVNRVVVALEDRRGKLPVDRLIDLRFDGVMFEEDTALFERSSGQLQIDHLRPSQLLFGEGFIKSRLRWGCKRLLDIALSTGLLLFTAPLMVITAILIRLETPGPVLYRQERTGRKGEPFSMIKFRSMVQDAEKDGRAQWAQEKDPRVTRVGAIIRKLRIDELPQLFNILRGDMSFVGPRPERPCFVKQLEESIPYYRLRAFVRPGLTGWAQVRYRYGASANDAREKLKYDLYYLKYAGPMLDMEIVLRTIRVVLTGFGAR